jgi:hypothetical protein
MYPLQCKTCGCVGTEDDGIELGGECVTENCSGTVVRTLACDMDHDCAEPVTHIDANGFAYCTPHGIQRRYWKSCRKLRPHELRRLERGEPIKSY